LIGRQGFCWLARDSAGELKKTKKNKPTKKKRKKKKKSRWVNEHGWGWLGDVVVVLFRQKHAAPVNQSGDVCRHLLQGSIERGFFVNGLDSHIAIGWRWFCDLGGGGERFLHHVWVHVGHDANPTPAPHKRRLRGLERPRRVEIHGVLWNETNSKTVGVCVLPFLKIFYLPASRRHPQLSRQFRWSTPRPSSSPEEG